MIACKRCHSHVDDSLSHCPVCGSFLQVVEPKHREKLYANPNYQHIEKQAANHLHAFFAFPLLLALFITLIIDLTLIANELGTTFMMTFIVFYMWVLIYKTIYNRQGIGYIVLWQLSSLSIGTIIIAFVATGSMNAWPLQYVVPILISISNVLFFIITTIKRKTDVILFQMFVTSLIGFIQFSLIYWILDEDIIVPSLIAGITSLINLTSLITYLRKKFIDYLQRWLHI